MFTDFLAECRAHKLQLGLGQRDVMGAANLESALGFTEVPKRVAAAA